ncbi:FGGY family carbohydrate kinase [Streptomyces sp. NBC_00258]|uniref:FGGY family carbohydrate kinase n=1 Tax=Streptomyces sp. NBC_00258 TaxID=2903642 RepID=UPI002E2817AF|nr:FGGY family carbohydrate kinase [Streptomyces sp. NBC_00258]
MSPAASARDAVLALDQGTSGTKGMLVAEDGTVLATAYRALSQQYPAPGHVEQEPEALWTTVVEVLRELAMREGVRPVGLGLSVQREAVLVWERATGRPLSRLVSWQDRRTAERCAELAQSRHAGLITERTGLPVDPMFSASKAAWLLDDLDPGRGRARAGLLRVGTVDAWLLHRLTGGATEAVETGSASRTQLLNLATGEWDPELAEIFGVPLETLPAVTASTGDFGRMRGVPGVPDGLPIAAVLGDSHAALFAQSHGEADVVKATYGSGSSLMMLCPQDVKLPHGIARTIAWRFAGQEPARALEANIASAGTAVRWAARLLGTDTAGVAELAATGRDSGLHLVPAFDGLGAPYWDRDARAVLSGIQQDTGPAELARAAVESLAYQVADTLTRFEDALGPVAALCADGGPTANERLMSFQTELTGCPVLRAGVPELSALGVAQLAGMALGLWRRSDLAAVTPPGRRFAPIRGQAWREARMVGWRQAVARARVMPT